MSLSEQSEPRVRDELGPYDEGWNAYLYGFEKQTNPYLHEEDEHDLMLAWWSGWSAAMHVSVSKKGDPFGRIITWGPANVKGHR